MNSLRPIDRKPQTLAELWNESTLFAPRWVVRRSILTGLVALGAFALDHGPSQYSVLYLVIGCFGARALLVGRDGRLDRVARIAIDVTATGAATILVLQALKLLLGGTVGLIRA